MDTESEGGGPLALSLVGGPPEEDPDEPGPVWLYVGAVLVGGGPCPPGGGGTDERGTVTLDVAVSVVSESESEGGAGSVAVTVGTELKSLPGGDEPDGGGKTL